ncbi:MAG: thioesterase family protein [Candidatus Bathyarchaeia archaeon]
MKYKIELRYADTDQMGLIYFARHLIYADEAIGKFLKEIGIDILGLENSGIYMAVVHADIDFKNPLRYGENCEVEVEVGKVGNSSLTMKFSIFGNDVLKSTGHVVYVFVDRNGRKLEVPVDIKEKLKALITKNMT